MALNWPSLSAASGLPVGFDEIVALSLPQRETEGILAAASRCGSSNGIGTPLESTGIGVSMGSVGGIGSRNVDSGWEGLELIV